MFGPIIIKRPKATNWNVDSEGVDLKCRIIDLVIEQSVPQGPRPTLIDATLRQLARRGLVISS